ncbi:sensor domain-containing protein [Micromonospora halotolerans]|uniref:histidine kinase n=1 Tax=Micromonospora halotolerans TaxID=709879 RepID=A0ABZ0A4Q3_9ACTN|nr:sensor domain-containing protein [Micromonospora halotolerans]WNM42434.1 sensor domain-containing protein [Micromonospora halotolerans]
MTTATARSVAYLAAGILAGAAGFAWTVVALVTVALLSVTQLGGPVFLGAAWLTRRLATAERHRAGWVLGRPLDEPYEPTAPGTVRERVAAVARQPATWRDLAWLVASFPVGLVTGVAGTVLAIVPVATALAPAWLWAVPNGNAPWPLRPLLTTTPGRFAFAAIGLLVLPVAAWLVRALARGVASGARALLAPGAHLRLVNEAARLAETRARVVDAQAAELRRIERDLHDGAQARIVAAGMTLALAARKLRAGGPAVSDVDLARSQLDEALAELRRLVRGIHPPILTDRGLHAALAALAADSPLDVSLSGDPDARHPAAVESAAYFVVAEGLANAAKHAEASRCTIVLTPGRGTLTVRLTDDGKGGADLAGSGLDGLRRRVEALDGTLTLTSPPGGPTVLHAELPCAS